MSKPKLPKGDWLEVTGDDWADQELHDGTEFKYAVEIRSFEWPGSYEVHYFAVLDQ